MCVNINCPSFKSSKEKSKAFAGEVDLGGTQTNILKIYTLIAFVNIETFASNLTKTLKSSSISLILEQFDIEKSQSWLINMIWVKNHDHFAEFFI